MFLNACAIPVSYTHLDVYNRQPNGVKYHASSSCSTLKKSRTIIQGTVDEARAAGKDALCKVCGH